MKEALLQIKADLGEDAVILKTTQLPRPLFGMGSGDTIEVTAAIDDDVLPLRPKPITLSRKSEAYERPKPLTTRTPVITAAPWMIGREKSASASPIRDTVVIPAIGSQDVVRMNELKDEIRELREIVKSALLKTEPAQEMSPENRWDCLCKKMIDAEVAPSTARDLIAAIRMKYEVADALVDETFLNAVQEYFPTAGPIGYEKNTRRIVAFVGPTGAGKTTTIAKLVAHSVLKGKRKVSIITADTYRIAAIDQMKSFADIVNVELQVVFSPSEVPEALAACANDDIVFVDTAGRSQKNKEHMDELEQFLGQLAPHEVHLVVSATTKDSDLKDIVTRYHALGADRLLFTKLDETNKLGNILNIVNTSRMPVSFFTTGQSVPDDIELVKAPRFIQRLLEGSL